MEKLIEDANKYAKANGQAADLSIDSFSDIVTAIELIQEKQNIAGTTAKEAATTIEGSVGQMKSAWENLLAGFGNEDADVSSLFNNFVKSALTAAENVIPRLGVIFQSIAAEMPGMIQSVAEAIYERSFEYFMDMQEMIPGIVESFVAQARDEIPALGNQLQGMLLNALDFLGVDTAPVEGLVQSFMPLVEQYIGYMQQVAQSVMPIVNTVMQYVQPLITNIINLITALANTISPILIPAIQAVQSVVTDVMGAIQPIIAATFEYINSIITTITAALNGDWDAFWDGLIQSAQNSSNLMQSIVSGAFNAVKSAVMNILGGAVGLVTGIFNRIASGVTGAVSSLVGRVSGGFRSIVSGIRSVLSGVVNAIKSPFVNAYNAVKVIVDKIKAVFSGVKLELPKFKIPHLTVDGGSAPWGIGGKGKAPSFDIQWYAKGGIFNGANVIGVGEAGPEAVLPLNSRTLGEIADGISAQGAGGDVYNITMTVSGAEDPEEWGRRFIAGIKRQTRMGVV